MDLSKTFGRYPTITERSVPDWSVSEVECESAIINSLIVGEVSSRWVLRIPDESVYKSGRQIQRYVPDWGYTALVGTYMPTAKRDPNQSKSGKAPTFQIRITPELKAQFEAAAKAEGMSLGNWLKTLARNELCRLGIKPHN